MGLFGLTGPFGSPTQPQPPGFGLPYDPLLDGPNGFSGPTGYPTSPNNLASQVGDSFGGQQQISNTSMQSNNNPAGNFVTGFFNAGSNLIRAAFTGPGLFTLAATLGVASYAGAAAIPIVLTALGSIYAGGKILQGAIDGNGESLGTGAFAGLATFFASQFLPEEFKVNGTTFKVADTGSRKNNAFNGLLGVMTNKPIYKSENGQQLGPWAFIKESIRGNAKPISSTQASNKAENVEKSSDSSRTSPPGPMTNQVSSRLRPQKTETALAKIRRGDIDGLSREELISLQKSHKTHTGFLSRIGYKSMIDHTEAQRNQAFEDIKRLLYEKQRLLRDHPGQTALVETMDQQIEQHEYALYVIPRNLRQVLKYNNPNTTGHQQSTYEIKKHLTQTYIKLEQLKQQVNGSPEAIFNQLRAGKQLTIQDIRTLDSPNLTYRTDMIVTTARGASRSSHANQVTQSLKQTYKDLTEYLTNTPVDPAEKKINDQKIETSEFKIKSLQKELLALSPERKQNLQDYDKFIPPEQKRFLSDTTNLLKARLDNLTNSSEYKNFLITKRRIEDQRKVERSKWLKTISNRYNLTVASQAAKKSADAQIVYTNNPTEATKKAAQEAEAKANQEAKNDRTKIKWAAKYDAASQVVNTIQQASDAAKKVCALRSATPAARVAAIETARQKALAEAEKLDTVAENAYFLEASNSTDAAHMIAGLTRQVAAGSPYIASSFDKAYNNAQNAKNTIKTNAISTGEVSIADLEDATNAKRGVALKCLIQYDPQLEAENLQTIDQMNANEQLTNGTNMQLATQALALIVVDEKYRHYNKGLQVLKALNAKPEATYIKMTSNGKLEIKSDISATQKLAGLKALQQEAFILQEMKEFTVGTLSEKYQTRLTQLEKVPGCSRVDFLNQYLIENADVTGNQTVIDRRYQANQILKESYTDENRTQYNTDKGKTFVLMCQRLGLQKPQLKAALRRNGVETSLWFPRFANATCDYNYTEISNFIDNNYPESPGSRDAQLQQNVDALF
ncbi:MAG: nucleoporin [Cyanobacteria bacterium P01_H01_bin.74]